MATTKTSLEVTKGGSLVDPIPLDTSASNSVHDEAQDLLQPFPTEEEWATLPRVAGTIPWTAWTVAVVEFVERFSYYGTSAVFVNFIQKDLPPGSTTGAGFLIKPGSGALGMGQRASTGLTTFNQFWSYITPLAGAYLADQYWGRYLTIQYSNIIALIGHTILIISAIPPVIVKPDAAIAIFSVGLVIMGIGTGGFKSNISPLIAEQYKDQKAYVRVNKKGRREIVDPAATTARIYIYFYMLINMGSLAGSLAMVYSEHFVGFWLSYTLPTICYLFCPGILLYFKKKYKLSPPTGSVMGKASKLIRLAFRGRGSWNPSTLKKNLRDPQFWDRVKPSVIRARGEIVPAWMTFDDEWVDEVRRGLLACKVFLWYPLYWLAYNQMTNNLVSQASTMELGRVPNDIISKLNPIFIIVVIPIMDFGVYPMLRNMGINFTPIKKITAGFALSSFAMVSACVTQYYIYSMSACGSDINQQVKDGRTDCTAPISVWVQVFPYGLIGMSEVMASITKLEYAYTKAPQNMRSTVQAIALSTSAFSAALGQALTGLSEDPLLVWNYGSVAVVAMVGGIGFYLTFQKADANEDSLNNLKESKFIGKGELDEESSVESRSVKDKGPVEMPAIKDEKTGFH
ncbi:MFS peptide transporter-like protein Ptr2 [Lojkania enalia]|uniref:MFS peptide transporter-like protein Ptr2 n=1 Tax=Lojkania enalia TaxID=147567 RepID=A0A9P4K025_9PLEO|nr:MFS peptide transporter-like protein Ptr2 [Didymosphaeria enalia]